MQSTLENASTLSVFIFMGLSVTGFLLIIALFMKISNGLFWARTIEQYKQAKNDPNFKQERDAGKKITNWIFKYIPPIFTGFVILLILIWLKIIG